LQETKRCRLTAAYIRVLRGWGRVAAATAAAPPAAAVSAGDSAETVSAVAVVSADVCSADVSAAGAASAAAAGAGTLLFLMAALQNLQTVTFLPSISCSYSTLMFSFLQRPHVPLP